MDNNETIVKESSMKVVVNVGIGTATLELDGCQDIQMLYALKEAFVDALENAQFDVQNVKTTIEETE